ncbi:hypothetical protein AAG570_009646, partial [Ranatra chinensis]
AGIGRETAFDIAKRGARVILACRNLESANQVKEEIVRETKNENIVVLKLDLSSLKSVREFAAAVNKSESRLDVLIHNAGVANTRKETTEDGLEMTMATNHYGPFLLTHLLIDLLKRSAPSRIVVVSSLVYKLGKVNINNPNPVNTFPPYLYFVSKYANILFTRELSRRLEGTGVTANSLHPGLVDTGIWRSAPFPLILPLKLALKSFSKNPKEGAQTTIYLAVSEEVEGVTGKYFEDCKVCSYYWNTIFCLLIKVILKMLAEKFVICCSQELYYKFYAYFNRCRREPKIRDINYFIVDASIQMRLKDEYIHCPVNFFFCGGGYLF